MDVANHFAQLCFDGGKDFMQKKKKKNSRCKEKGETGRPKFVCGNRVVVANLLIYFSA